MTRQILDGCLLQRDWEVCSQSFKVINSKVLISTKILFLCYISIKNRCAWATDFDTWTQKAELLTKAEKGIVINN